MKDCAWISKPILNGFEVPFVTDKMNMIILGMGQGQTIDMILPKLQSVTFLPIVGLPKLLARQQFCSL